MTTTVGSKAFWVILTAIIASLIGMIVSAAVNPFQAATKTEVQELDTRNTAEHTGIKRDVGTTAGEVRKVSTDIKAIKCQLDPRKKAKEKLGCWMDQ